MIRLVFCQSPLNFLVSALTSHRTAPSLAASNPAAALTEATTVEAPPVTIAMIKLVFCQSPLNFFVSAVSPRPPYFSVIAAAAVTAAATWQAPLKLLGLRGPSDIPPRSFMAEFVAGVFRTAAFTTAKQARRRNIL